MLAQVTEELLLLKNGLNKFKGRLETNLIGLCPFAFLMRLMMALLVTLVDTCPTTLEIASP